MNINFPYLTTISHVRQYLAFYFPGKSVKEDQIKLLQLRRACPMFRTKDDWPDFTSL